MIMRLLTTCWAVLWIEVVSSAQLQIQFQSVGSAGTTLNQASNGTNLHSMAVSAIATFGAGQSNDAGFFLASLVLAPSTQASDIIFSNVASTQLTLSWTAGTGANRLVVAQSVGTINATPTYGITYAANAAFGLGAQIGTGNYVIYSGYGNSVTVTGLSPSAVYSFQVFEYNGTGLTTVYKATTASGNPANQTTLASPATIQTSGLSFSNLANNKVTLSWTNGNGANRIIAARQASAVNAMPISGQGYSANAAFGSGDQLATGNYVVYNGAGNSVTITGLLSNTSYYFQAFEYNGASATSNYLTNGTGNRAQQLTLTDATVAAAATDVTQTSFVASWSTVAGASGYSIDVSADGFATLASGYNNASISGASTTVSGLSPGMGYQYRIRANNASGSSANSNSVSVLTIPATPVGTSATAVTQTGFTANWSMISGATNYFIDVASDAGFTSMLSGYNNISVTTNSLSVAGLNAGTTYYYQVRATNATGTSPSSNAVSQITIPSAPTGLASSSVGSTQFIISWNAVAGADSYSVDVSKSADFSNLLAGYNGFSTTVPSAVITGLSPSTAYYYRVRAVNAGGNSPAAVGLPPVGTLDASGNSVSLSVNVTSQSNLAIPSVNGTAKVSAQTTGGFGTVSVTLLYRGITDPNFTSTPLTLSGGNYSFTVTSAMADSLGIEYYFIAMDEIGQDSTAHNFIYNTIDAASGSAIPFSDVLNGSTSTYQLFSVPYVISDRSIATVFSALGAYDKTKWRLFHFQNGNYAEYQNGLTNIDLGSGYWFNTTEKVSIKPGAGSVVNTVTQSTPYTLTLAQGWNQIGNPFPFPISWSAVQAANSGSNLNPLWAFNSSGYAKVDGFKPWTGAFVWSDNGGNISIPVSAKCKGCRIASSESISPPNLDEDAWQLPISLRFNGREQVSGIGMDPQASLSKDRFDEITVPRFVEYLEMNTYHQEYFDPYFSTDIVPNSSQGSWEFTLSSNQREGYAVLRWDQTAIQNNVSKLALLDGDGGVLIDMKAANQYTLTWSEGKKIKIIFNKDGDIVPDVTVLGQAYPNPFNSGIIIPILLDQDQSQIQIQIYDMLGRKVRAITEEQVKAGSFQLEWDGQNEQGNKVDSGLYIYQLHGDKGILSTAKKVIKQ